MENVYIGQEPVQIIWLLNWGIKAEMEKNWITWFIPMFEDEEKAKEFCWNKYLTMKYNKQPL